MAPLVWSRFGEVRNYVEPFAGSLAVLLARPGEPGIETVNDSDAFLSNFWRAVAADPDQVAHFADWPVNEADLHARHRWLVETAAERVERLKADPDFYDAKVAGWWVWGQCLWIGSGWCQAAELRKDGLPREKLFRGGNPVGINSGTAQRLPGERRPHLGGTGGGHGINKTTVQKRPALTGHGGGVGVHAPGLGKLPLIGGEAKGIHRKRPVLQHGKGGRGVQRLSHQVPDLSGDAGAAGRGIYASRFEEKSGGLQAYMRALSDRLRRVRVCCGDFERILGPAATTCIGLTGVLLDPPYDNDLRAICYNHDGPEAETGVSVWWRAYRWAIDHGGDPLLRIALCGYEHPDASFPPGWTCAAWKASGGYGRSERGKANARRERVWFSPHCLQAEQRHLFEPE